MKQIIGKKKKQIHHWKWIERDERELKSNLMVQQWKNRIKRDYSWVM